MEQKFKIQVPDGCSAKIEQQDGFLVVAFEPKKWNPKDGDVYVTNDDGIGIYNANRKHPEGVIPCYLGLAKDGVLNIWTKQYTWGFGREDTMRPTTKEEKKRLFEALAKEKKRLFEALAKEKNWWDPYKKQIEDLPRWRAKDGEKYYFVSDCLDVDFNSEDFDEYDDSYYAAGNYFKTERAASRAAEKIRKILKKSEAE